MKPIKTRLLLPEYGRNVQKMVRYIKTIEDRDKRNEQARVVVAVMGNIYPYKRDTEDFRHMLWDHLFMIADFELDVDAPFEKPTPEMFQPKPQQIPYPQRRIKYKHYGDTFRRMIRKIIESDSPVESKNASIAIVAKFIRQQSHNFNHDYPSNEVVLSDLQEVCRDDYQIDPTILDSSKIEQTSTLPRAKIVNNRRNKNTRTNIKKR